MSRVESVTIRRFKRLQEVTVPLGDATLLIGANNAGKSSVLQAIHFAVSVAQSARLVGEGVAWQRGSFELSFNPAQLIYAPVADVMALASGGTLQEPRESRVEILIAMDDGSSCTVGLRRGRNRNIAVQIEGRALGERLMSLEQPFSVYAPGLAGVPKSESYASSGVVRRIVARGDANLVLRNVLRMLYANPQAWAAFINDMRAIFPEIDISVAFNESTDEHIEAFFRLPGGPRLPVDAAGTSILQASQILAYIGLFRPQVLILDEPDSHLHPNNQRALCDLVYRLASERGFQALISTHSRHVLDAMRERGNVVWMSRGRIVAEEDKTLTAMLLEIGALDSADYFADETIRCVVATEDADTSPLRALLWSNGFREDDTEVASYAGSTNVQAALVLGNFLRAKAPNLNLVVHKDRDYLPQVKVARFERRLTEQHFHPFVTSFSDIEGYFLNPAHLAYVNPGLSEERATALILDATDVTADESIRAIINQRTQEAYSDRRAGGANIDHGQVALDARTDYLADPAGMSRGKLVVGRLLGLIQQELGGNPRIYVASPHLHVIELQQISAAIWAGGPVLPGAVPQEGEALPAMPTPVAAEQLSANLQDEAELVVREYPRLARPEEGAS